MRRELKKEKRNAILLWEDKLACKVVLVWWAVCRTPTFCLWLDGFHFTFTFYSSSFSWNEVKLYTTITYYTPVLYLPSYSDILRSFLRCEFNFLQRSDFKFIFPVLYAVCTEILILHLFIISSTFWTFHSIMHCFFNQQHASYYLFYISCLYHLHPFSISFRRLHLHKI